MFRLYAMTFQGQFRGTEKQRNDLHESPSAMTIPLIILAILSFAGGLVGIPEVFARDAHRLEHFLAPVLQMAGVSETSQGHLSHSFELMLMGATVLLILGAIFLALKTFSRYERKGESAGGLGRLFENKWYVDELYDAIVNKPLKSLGGFLNGVVEKLGIDGIVNGMGRGVQYAGRQLRLLQSGQVGSYILIMVVATVILFIIQLFWKH